MNNIQEDGQQLTHRFYMKLSRILRFNSLPVVKMQLIARFLAGKLRAGDIITLSGEVGAGKTTFARGLIGAIAPVSVEVTSPTFNLMQSYDVTLAGGGMETLWHLDLYRLKRREEAEELGLRELWPHITLIEWPEIIAEMLPPQRLDVAFDFGENDNTRSLELSGDEEWQKRINSINSIWDIHEQIKSD